MRHETTTAPLPNPRANGAGAARPIRDLIDKYVQIQGGTRDYSIAIEYSIDEGATFHELVAAAAGAVAPTEFPQPATHFRAVISLFVSETTAPTVTLSGRNAQTSP